MIAARKYGALTRLATSLASLCVVPFGLGAQTLDITHYDLTIRPDYAAQRIAIRARMELLNPALQDSVMLQLDPAWEIQSARANSAPVPPRRAAGILVTAIPKVEKVTLEFEIARANGRSNGAARSIMGEQDLFLIWSDRFYPADFDDWATVNTTVTVPGGFWAIAPGKVIRAEEGTTASTFEYATTSPVSAVSVFADKRWARANRMVNGIRMQTLLHQSPSAQSEQLMASGGDLLRYYRSLHGGYPYDGFAVITLEGIDDNRAFPGFVAMPATATAFNAHEAAQLYWTWALRGRGLGAWHWTVGFGDYLEVLYAEARKQPLSALMEQYREQYLAAAGQDEPILATLNGTPEMQKYVHGRLPWLLHVLRYEIGDGDFRDGLKLLYEQHRFSTFTIDDLVKAFEAAAKEPLGWWRDEWLTRTGVPDLDITYRVNSSAEGPLTVVTVRQRGAVYVMPLDLIVEKKIERVQLTDRVNTFSFRTIAEPKALVVDPKRWLLAKISVRRE